MFVVSPPRQSKTQWNLCYTRAVGTRKLLGAPSLTHTWSWVFYCVWKSVGLRRPFLYAIEWTGKGLRWTETVVSDKSSELISFSLTNPLLYAFISYVVTNDEPSSGPLTCAVCIWISLIFCGTLIRDTSGHGRLYVCWRYFPMFCVRLKRLGNLHLSLLGELVYTTTR